MRHVMIIKLHLLLFTTNFYNIVDSDTAGVILNNGELITIQGGANGNNTGTLRH